MAEISRHFLGFAQVCQVAWVRDAKHCANAPGDAGGSKVDRIVDVAGLSGILFWSTGLW